MTLNEIVLILPDIDNIHIYFKENKWHVIFDSMKNMKSVYSYGINLDETIKNVVDIYKLTPPMTMEEAKKIADES